MKKKILTIAMGAMIFSLTGCYTQMCPTYSVKPMEKPAKQVAKQLENSLEKAS
ncbi:hypothetical protein [Tunicatimonas pelagia]|uniref:hypothetical protein n=1 Tax=Tunicatimonas pelagia TaxID=931531 RepID=UPI0026654452|nr:hypothetical protein [Tunicatimonas pelagia]WKN45678.1 hypothetical protein P0M28_11995 [Tunicatimonas pelagia]